MKYHVHIGLLSTDRHDVLERVQWKATKICWQECMSSTEKQKTLKKKRLKGDLSALFNYYKGGYIEREDEAMLFLKACNKRIQDSGNKLKHGIFH